MKLKKFWFLLVVLCIVFASIVVLTACGNNKSDSDEIAGVDNSNGYLDGSEKEEAVTPHTHKIVRKNKVNATCSSEGNQLYYSCEVCGKKFADRAGTIEITNVVIPKNNVHVGGTWIARAENPTEDKCGYTGDTYCRGCGQMIKKGQITDKLVHLLTKIEAKSHTCTENGNIEYYTCTNCYKYYSDENGTNEIAFADTVIAATHNLTHTEAKASTCTESGNVEYYTCSKCGKYYTDENGANEITNVVLPKNDNHIGGTEIRNAKVATEEEEGYTGDTYCLGCYQKIADGEVIKKLDHTHSMTKTEAKAATCTTDGNVEYYTCVKCGKYYTDESGTNEISFADTTIAATGVHVYENRQCTICRQFEATTATYDLSLNLDKSLVANIYAIGNGLYEMDIVGSGEMVYSYRPWTQYVDFITSVNIYDGVTSIEEYAFDGFDRLQSVTIGCDVKAIGNDAFYGCSRITSVNIKSLVSWCSIDFSDEDSNPLYCGNATLYMNGEALIDLVIPGNVSTVSPYAFYNYRKLESLTLCSGVSLIGYNAFQYCANLSSVSLGNVSSIGEYAFANCSSLTSITIPTSTKRIWGYAFTGCSSLSKVTLEYQGNWFLALPDGTGGYQTTGYNISTFYRVCISSPSDVAKWIKGDYSPGKWFHN